jgi:hypothetical protein
VHFPNEIERLSTRCCKKKKAVNIQAETREEKQLRRKLITKQLRRFLLWFGQGCQIEIKEQRKLILFSLLHRAGRLMLMGGLVNSRAACRAISARRHTTAHNTVSSSVLCFGYVVNKTFSCVLMNMIFVTII